MSQLSQKSINVAESQLDLQEEPRGSNWGPHVKKYLNSVNINFPASWCMAFVYWCFLEAAKQLNLTTPLIKTGGVLAHYNKAKPEFKKTSPEIGDIFIMDLGKGLGHTGIVTAVRLDSIDTIEGNTNDSGSREGYEVCRRNRQKSTIKGYLRY